MEHRNILRVDNPGPFDTIDLCSVEGLELDGVAGCNVFQSSEEAVTVTRDARVSVRSRPRRVGDVTNGTIQRNVIRPFEHRHFEAHAGDAQDRERCRTGILEGVPPRRDALPRPEGLIWRIGLLRGRGLEHGEAIQQAPSSGDGIDLESTPGRDADDTDSPGGSLREQPPSRTPTFRRSIHGWRSYHSRSPLPGENDSAASIQPGPWPRPRGRGLSHDGSLAQLAAAPGPERQSEKQ